MIHLYVEPNDDTDELIYTTETDSETLKTDLQLPKRKGWWWARDKLGG